jgi:hypothetical protein
MIKILRKIFGLCEHTPKIIHDEVTHCDEFSPDVRVITSCCTKCGKIMVKRIKSF